LINTIRFNYTVNPLTKSTEYSSTTQRESWLL